MNLNLITRDDLIDLIRNDETVRNAVREAVSLSVNAYSDTDIVSKLKEELTTANSRINVLESELEAERQKNQEKLKKLYENDVKSYNDKITLLEKKLEPFNSIAEIWESFDSIAPSEISLLTELCGKRDVYAFISLGRTIGKIKQLMQAVKDFVSKHEDDINTIEWYNRYLRFCIDLYNKTKSEDEDFIKRIDVQIGTDYNSSISVKTNSSSLNGTVTRILVDGYEGLLKPIVVTE